MTRSFRSALLNSLREEIAFSISDEKSYIVPGLCKRLGLREGTEEEAFKGKSKYALSRLIEIDQDKLLEIGRQLILESPAKYPLLEAVRKFENLDVKNITEVTRRRIMKFIDSYPLTNIQEPIELVRFVWPLSEIGLRSYYSGCERIEDEVIRHFVSFSDWTNSELLQHLGFIDCSTDQVFLFLEALVNPLFADEGRQIQFVSNLNGIIEHDGFALLQDGMVSGSPIFKVSNLRAAPPSDDGISKALLDFDEQTIHTRWAEALKRREHDPQGAITLARTLLEDVCKWILGEAGKQPGEKDDLPKLYRNLSVVLNLAPDAHTEQAFKQILGSCQQVVETIGSLRNKLGDAHSQGPLRAKPKARHSELVVNLAGAMATFLVATWKEK